MKRFAPMLFLIASLLQAQTLLLEPFDYPAKDSLDGMGGWNSSKVIKSKIAVVAPGLTFPGYAGGGFGNAVRFPNVDNGDLCSKQLVKIDSGSVYLSYLLRVDSLAPTATAGYNVAMDQYGGSTNVNLRAVIKRANDSAFTIGVQKYQSLVYSTTTYKTKQTYLVVVRYDFIPGTANDTARLYVFSSAPPAAAPVKADTLTGAGTDAADIGEIWLSNAFVQSGLKGSSVTVDEVRVGRSWEAAIGTPTSTILTEDFYYAQGDTLRGTNGWDVYTNGVPMAVDSLGLTYSGYHGSGAGRALKIAGGSGSQTLYRPFAWTSDTNVYLSAMVNITGNAAAQGYFLSLTNNTAGNYRAVVYAKIENGAVQFGLRPTLSGTLMFDTTKYQTGKTYLLVVKYSYVPGVNNDEIALFVYASGIPYVEPPRPNVGPLVMPADNINPMGVALNSGAFTAGVNLQGAIIRVDGIRITKERWRNGLTQVRTAAAAMPEGFVLEQNYPNPFNPSTTITYHLAAAGEVRLAVYDALGREVTTLVNEMLNAGVYTARWDASGYSSGLYFAKLTSGGAMQVKKMLLIR